MGISRLLQSDITWGYYFNGMFVRRVSGDEVAKKYNGAPLFSTGCEFIYEPDQHEYCCHYADNNLSVTYAPDSDGIAHVKVVKGDEEFTVLTAPRWNSRGLAKSIPLDALELARCCDVSDECRSDIEKEIRRIATNVCE